MKFIVYRTSGESPPCEGASRELDSYARWEEAEATDEGFIYTIDINSLEDLLELISRNGAVVVSLHRDDIHYPVPEIEIYDAFREES